MQLLLDANERRVVGINVNKDGQDFVVKCNREVLVAAGAIESPKILMLSGIGPGEHLTKHGVRRKADCSQFLLLTLIVYELCETIDHMS